MSALSAALILQAVQGFGEHDELIRKCRERLVKVLLSVRVQEGAFSEHPCVTSLALAGVLIEAPERVDGAMLAHWVKKLIALEIKPGGPYSVAGVIDPGINAIFARVLALQEIELPQVRAYLDDVLERGDLRSGFFSPAFCAYLLARVCPESLRQRFSEHIRVLRSSIPQSAVISHALCISSLALLGSVTSDEFHEMQKLALHGYDDSDTTPIYSASEHVPANDRLLNNALLFEALQRAAHVLHLLHDRQQLPMVMSDDLVDQEFMMERIMQFAVRRFAVLDDDLQQNAQREIEKTMRGNTDRQMSLMAYFMRKAMGEHGVQFSDDRIAELGLANAYFWTAFIIYDNFWDEDEEAVPSILPTANLYAREFIRTFERAFADKPDVRAWFHTLMDKLDAANTWETMHCRTRIDGDVFFIPERLPDFGTYDKKYQPASAHILGPVAMLIESGYRLDDPDVQNLIAYFRNYLIPMQINDDLHDWEEDMERGSLSSVVAMLLADLDLNGRTSLHLKHDLPELKRTFWFKTMPKACALMRTYLDQSRSALYAISCVADPVPLERYIVRIEKSIAEAEAEYQRTSEFLKVYSG